MNSYAVDETIKGLVHQCNKHRYQLLLNYTGLEIDGEISALKHYHVVKLMESC